MSVTMRVAVCSFLAYATTAATLGCGSHQGARDVDVDVAMIGGEEVTFGEGHANRVASLMVYLYGEEITEPRCHEPLPNTYLAFHIPERLGKFELSPGACETESNGDVSDAVLVSVDGTASALTGCVTVSELAADAVSGRVELRHDNKNWADSKFRARICPRCSENDDCSEPTPACDPATLICVECTTGSDCTEPLVACDLATNACVECLENDDCRAPVRMCDVPRQRCVECIGDDDCSAPTSKCDLTTNTCVECLENGDCASSTPVCDATTNSCVECLSASDCATPTPACDAATSSCVQCLTDGDCADAYPICDIRTNTCAGCLSDGDCPFGAPSCDAATRSCSGCSDDSTCFGRTPICDLGTNACVECIADAHCPRAESARCNGTVCSPCETHDDCAHLTNTPDCLAGACTVLARDCEPCTNDQDCLGSELEDPTRRCVFIDPRQYCLRRVAAGCEAPFSTPTAPLPSVSGAADETYCGPFRTSCEAALDYLKRVECGPDANTCGCRDADGPTCTGKERGGYCDNNERCTIYCEAPDSCGDGDICDPTTAQCVTGG